MDEIVEKIQIDGPDKRWWDFRPLFRTRANRYSAYMCILIGMLCIHIALQRNFNDQSQGVFGQLSGNGLITYFLPILLGQAGIPQERRLTLNFVNSVTS